MFLEFIPAIIKINVYKAKSGQLYVLGLVINGNLNVTQLIKEKLESGCTDIGNLKNTKIKLNYQFIFIT